MDKILYADDDADIQEIIKSILAKENFEVTIAKDGIEALNLATQNKPDVILLDYLMPGLSGLQVLEALRKNQDTKSIPVIMVTAYPNEKEESLSKGAVDFINKPVDKIDLLLRIRSVLKVRHIENELQKMIAYIAELEK